jgi:prevent-host-death family protein
MTDRPRIGVRELRQHASQHLRRVARGESLDVTDRGRVVARLVPVTDDPWEDLIAAGRVVPGDDETDVADEPAGTYDVDASATLEAMRADER